MYISAIINAIKQDFFIFWRKSGIHESVLVWHFLNCRLWENEGAEVFLGWKLTMVHKSPNIPIVYGIGKAMLGQRSIGVHTTILQSHSR